MSKAAVVRFADKILQHFPPYRWDEEQEKAWAKTMVDELSGVPDEVIERASKEMVRTRRKEKTPLVSECIDACDEAQQWINRERSKGSLIKTPEISQYLGFSDDRKRFADTLIGGELGRQAVKEGWQVPLRDFARKHGRLPQLPMEINGCKQTAREFDQSWAEVKAGRGGLLQKELYQMGLSMLARRDEVAKWIMGQ